MMDVSAAYRRYQFLGGEFLTWLWFVIENEPDLLRTIDADLLSLEIGNRMVLERRPQRGSLETVTIKGDHAGMEEGLLAVRKGALVAEMNLVFTAGDNQWHFTLKGESLNVSGLKVPETAPTESTEEVEGAVIDKTFLCDRIVQLVENFFRRFIELRLGKGWSETLVPRMRKWIIDETDLSTS
jgi:hypothetical protein